MTFDNFLRTTLPDIGLNWTRFRNKRTRRLIAIRLSARNQRSWEEYREFLVSDGLERARLRQTLCVTISRFWRNEAVFRQIERVLLPSIISSLAPDEPLVVWSAGTSSGQEAFSVSVAYQRHPLRRDHKLIIVASDANRHVLSRARVDRWTAGELREIPRDVMADMFELTQEGRVIRQTHRDSIQFVQSSLFAYPPLKEAHIVLCRNSIVTYFTGETRREAMQRVVEVVKPGGYLILGRKEKLPNGWATRWGLAHMGRKIYRKLD